MIFPKDFFINMQYQQQKYAYSVPSLKHTFHPPPPLYSPPSFPTLCAWDADLHGLHQQVPLPFGFQLNSASGMHQQGSEGERSVFPGPLPPGILQTDYRSETQFLTGGPSFHNSTFELSKSSLLLPLQTFCWYLSTYTIPPLVALPKPCLHFYKISL